MDSLDAHSLFLKGILDKTIDICTNIYNKQDLIEDVNKEEFGNLSSLATKEFCFILNEVLYKQKDGVAMGSPPSPIEFKPVFYSNQWIFSRKFGAFLIIVTLTCSFHVRKKKMVKMFFLDVKLSRENGKFVTTVYGELTFSGADTHFKSFLK